MIEVNVTDKKEEKKIEEVEAEEVVTDTNDSSEDVNEEEDGTLHSELGGEDIHTTEESINNVAQSYVDIFTESVDVTKNMAQIKAYKNDYMSNLNQLTKAITTDKKSLEEDKIKDIYNRFKLLGKEESALSNAEVDMLLQGIDLDLSRIETNSMRDLYEYKRSLLGLMIGAQQVSTIAENADIELEKITNDFNIEIDNLVTELDMTEKMNNVLDAMDKETDPEKKKKLQDIYSGIYASVNLNILMDKVKNKGLNVIRKECKKNYDKAKKKAIKTMHNDKTNIFMNPALVEETLQVIYPDNEEGIRIMLYIIFKKINKRNEVDKVTATFINYFLLNINKLSRPEFDREESELYHNIKKFLEDVA